MSAPGKFIRIRCGCCKYYFDAPLGGPAYCEDCLLGRCDRCRKVKLMDKS